MALKNKILQLMKLVIQGFLPLTYYISKFYSLYQQPSNNCKNISIAEISSYAVKQHKPASAKHHKQYIYYCSRGGH